MKRLAAAVAVIVVVGLVVTEVAMLPTAADRLAITTIYATSAVLTLAGFWWANRRLRYARSVRSAIQLVAVASVFVAAVTVVVAAQTMFFDDHDRNLVLVVLALGVGLGSALALAIGRSVTDDVTRLQSAADAVAAGDLQVRSRLDRRDELGDLSQAFDRMADRLAATETERSVFLASVGHDLRTPLASLRATLEAIEDGIVAPSAEVASAMGRDVDHLGKLVEDLFLFARTEAGSLHLDRQIVDLRELADEAVEAMTPLAARRDVSLDVSASSLVEAEVDPWAFGRVLRNLLDNAVRYSPPGATVEVVVGRSADTAEIRVVDQGPGFPAEFRQRAFERFTRADMARTSTGEGAGLGLAIARGLIDAHGGRISLASEPPTAVVVRLPLP